MFCISNDKEIKAEVVAFGCSVWSQTPEIDFTALLSVDAEKNHSLPTCMEFVMISSSEGKRITY